MQPVTVPGRSRPIAATELAAILLEYGNRQSNPVLDVLSADKAFQLNKKYPQERIRFGCDQWRAYYHGHDVPGEHTSDEHGHFHIFHRVASEGDIARDWSHVAALAMDNNGQPLRWFSVNNWVTGDAWLPGETLSGELGFETSETGLINRWLVAMLGFYREQIGRMLERRDAALQRLRGDRDLEDILSDRQVYFLSDAPINLLRDIGVALDQ